MAAAGGRPQLILAHRNDLVARLSERLTTARVNHQAVDARWFLDQGTGREAAFAALVQEAGHAGRVLVINMQGARGVDIPLTPDARAAGGLHVRVTARSGLSADIDIQAQNRAARSGDPGAVPYYISPGDDAFALSPRDDVQHAIIRYTTARDTTSTDIGTGTPADTGTPGGGVRAGPDEELARAGQALRDLIPRLQANAAARLGLYDPARPHAPRPRPRRWRVSAGPGARCSAALRPPRALRRGTTSVLTWVTSCRISDGVGSSRRRSPQCSTIRFQHEP